MADAIGCAVGCARDDHPAVAMPDQDGVSDVLVVQERDDVLDMAVEVDARSKQMRTLPNPVSVGA